MAAHWIVLVVGIITASIVFMDMVHPMQQGVQFAIFLALVARIVQADLHHKSQKQV